MHEATAECVLPDGLRREEVALVVRHPHEVPIRLHLPASGENDFLDEIEGFCWFFQWKLLFFDEILKNCNFENFETIAILKNFEICKNLNFPKIRNFRFCQKSNP